MVSMRPAKQVSGLEEIEPQDQRFMGLINAVAMAKNLKSDRQLSEAIGVEATTFSRWRKHGPFAYRVLRVFFSIADNLERSLDQLRAEIEDQAYETDDVTVEKLITEVNGLKPDELIRINVAIAKRMQDFM